MSILACAVLGFVVSISMNVGRDQGTKEAEKKAISEQVKTEKQAVISAQKQAGNSDVLEP